MSLSKDEILKQLKQTVAQLRAIEDSNENIREKDKGTLHNHSKSLNDKQNQQKFLLEKLDKKHTDLQSLIQQAEKFGSHLKTNNTSNSTQSLEILMNQIQISSNEVNQMQDKLEQMSEDAELELKTAKDIFNNQKTYEEYRALLDKREDFITELKNLNVNEQEILAAADLSPKIKPIETTEKRKTSDHVAALRKQEEEKEQIIREAWSRCAESIRKAKPKHTRPEWTLVESPSSSTEKTPEDNQPAIKDCFNLTGELKPGMYTHEKLKGVRLSVDEGGVCRFYPPPRSASAFEKCWRDLLRSFSLDMGCSRVELNYRMGEKANFDEILKILNFAKDEKLIIEFNDIIKDQLKRADPKMQAAIWNKVRELEAHQKQFAPIVHQYESTLLCEKNITALTSAVDEAKKSIQSLKTTITEQQQTGQSDGIKAKLQTLSEIAIKMDVSIEAVNKELPSITDDNHAKFKESVTEIKAQCDNMVGNMHRLQLNIPSELDSSFGKAERQLKEVSQQISNLNNSLEEKLQPDRSSRITF